MAKTTKKATNKALAEQTLFALVGALNKKYCKNTKNELRVSQAYGGYEVQLTGKKDKRFKKGANYLKNSLGSAIAQITYGHTSASETTNKLREYDSKGYVKDDINRFERRFK